MQADLQFFGPFFRRVPAPRGACRRLRTFRFGHSGQPRSAAHFAAAIRDVRVQRYAVFIGVLNVLRLKTDVGLVPGFLVVDRGARQHFDGVLVRGIDLKMDGSGPPVAVLGEFTGQAAMPTLILASRADDAIISRAVECCESMLSMVCASNGLARRITATDNPIHAVLLLLMYCCPPGHRWPMPILVG